MRSSNSSCVWTLMDNAIFARLILLAVRMALTADRTLRGGVSGSRTISLSRSTKGWRSDPLAQRSFHQPGTTVRRPSARVNVRIPLGLTHVLPPHAGSGVRFGALTWKIREIAWR
jgi:hypothetical protein